MFINDVFVLEFSMFYSQPNISGSLIIVRNCFFINGDVSVHFTAKNVKIDACIVEDFNVTSRACSFAVDVSEFSHISNCHITNCHTTDYIVMVLVNGSHHLDSLNISQCSAAHISSIMAIRCESVSKFLNIVKTTTFDRGVCIQNEYISKDSLYSYCNILDNDCPSMYGLLRNVYSLFLMNIESCSIFGNKSPVYFYGQSRISVKKCQFDSNSVTLSVTVDSSGISARTLYPVIVNSLLVRHASKSNRVTPVIQIFCFGIICERVNFYN